MSVSSMSALLEFQFAELTPIPARSGLSVTGLHTGFCSQYSLPGGVDRALEHFLKSSILIKTSKGSSIWCKKGKMVIEETY